MISTDGTGLTIGAANEIPQLKQKVASSLFVASHCEQVLTIVFPPNYITFFLKKIRLFY
jgi:hypothetical protein